MKDRENSGVIHSNEIEAVTLNELKTSLYFLFTSKSSSHREIIL